MKARVKELVGSVPPKVSVIVDSPCPDWVAPLNDWVYNSSGGAFPKPPWTSDLWLQWWCLEPQMCSLNFVFLKRSLSNNVRGHESVQSKRALLRSVLNTESRFGRSVTTEGSSLNRRLQGI